MPKLSEWYPADVKPVRVGVYQRKGAILDYSFWTGKRWSAGSGDPNGAFNHRGSATMCADFPWRGLTSPTEETP